MVQKLLIHLASIVLCLILSSCSQNKPQKVSLEHGCRILIPTPSILGDPFSAHHSLSFQAKDNTFQMQAQLEFENKILTIVGLNTGFATIFSLQQIENVLEYNENIKTKIKPKYLIGTYYLIFTPLDRIHEILDKKTICLEKTSGSVRTRSILVNKKEIFTIQYLPFKNGTKIIFHNKKRDLTFTIIEDYKTKL